ncbi:wall-associated receptor kinase 3-like protein [Carex littledalei]|uniref:Wall-associated receptor kinase 3-like protein n=1 Tax=Carex littledalei TaxID=544730 RepID=A0A833QDJ6_9POAL|nr:wall-associated receptor kinase 3-like protein [Carex littledalei]
MHPHWFSIFLSLCFTSVSLPLNSVAHGGGETGITSHCNSVPYPFGAPGFALNGFEVICTSTPTGNRTINYNPYWNSTQGNPNPSLRLPTGTYLIKNISLQGQVNIFTGPIYRQCNDNGTETLLHGNGWLNLTDTPFTLSKNDTTFIVLGCDDVVLIEGVAGDSNGSGNNFRSGGCVAFCSNPSSRIDKSCSGLGCCQMPLPGPGDLKSFELKLFKVPNSGVRQLTNCSTAFFTTHNEFLFRAAQFDNKGYFRDNLADHVVVLNWAIGEKSCEEAKKNLNSFACKKNSQCYDSPNGAGYLCNCSTGYKGNPYDQGGCSDIDECQNPENPCMGPCTNTDGSYICGCPSGKTGDSRKDGPGCSKLKKPSPLNVILGICLCLVFVLAMGSFYTYSRLQRRKLVKVRSEFFRQNGGWILQQRLASQGIDSTTKIFTSEELQRATDDYSENKILGQGGYGTVYKGVLSNEQVVAIKISKLIDENQKPISFARPEECRNLATYFASLVDEGRLIQATEPRLLKEAKFDELHFVAHLARRCINVKGEERPTMKEVASELEGLTKPAKKKINDENMQESERLIEETGSTSTISVVGESSSQYSLERQLLSINIEHAR